MLQSVTLSDGSVSQFSISPPQLLPEGLHCVRRMPSSGHLMLLPGMTLYFVLTFAPRYDTSLSIIPLFFICNINISSSTGILVKIARNSC